MANSTNAGSPFGDGFNIQVAQPIDYRMIVNTMAELTAPESFNNGIYAYTGMIVTVKDAEGIGEPNPKTFRLKSVPSGYTNIINWEPFAAGGDLSLDELTDVDVEDAQNGDVVVYNYDLDTWENHGPVVDDIFDAGTSGLGVRMTNGEVQYLPFSNLNQYNENNEYSSNEFIVDGENYTQSLSRLDEILAMLAPSQPDVLDNQTLQYSGPTRYVAKLSRGLSTKWYLNARQPGDTINNYITNTTQINYQLLSTNINDAFFIGKNGVQNDWGQLQHLIDGTVKVQVDLTSGTPVKSQSATGADGTATISWLDATPYPSSQPLWMKASAGIDYIQLASNEGRIQHSLHHTTTNTTTANLELFYDPIASPPAFSGGITLTPVAVVDKWLSGVAYYGFGTQVRVQYTAASGIHNRCYHPTAVSSISNLAFQGVNLNPGHAAVSNLPAGQTIPRFDDNHTVSYVMTLNIGEAPNQTVSYASSQGKSSGTNLGIVNVTLNKPHATINQIQNMARAICTYGIVSSGTHEYFFDESQRLYRDQNVAFSSINVLNNGEAQVANGKLIYGNVNFPAKTGNQEYQRRFIKASASNGTLVLNGINVNQIAPFGTGDLNVLIQLEAQGLWFDLGTPFGAVNGTGSGNSKANSIGGRVGTSSGSILNWTLGINNTALNNNRYRIAIIFRDTTAAKNMQITSIASS